MIDGEDLSYWWVILRVSAMYKWWCMSCEWVFRWGSCRAMEGYGGLWRVMEGRGGLWRDMERYGYGMWCCKLIQVGASELVGWVSSDQVDAHTYVVCTIMSMSTTNRHLPYVALTDTHDEGGVSDNQSSWVITSWVIARRNDEGISMRSVESGDC